MAELHAFAASIGVKEHFFHRGTTHPHYDITEAQVPAAIAAGAVLVSSKVLLDLAKKCFTSL